MFTFPLLRCLILDRFRTMVLANDDKPRQHIFIRLCRDPSASDRLLAS